MLGGATLTLPRSGYRGSDFVRWHIAVATLLANGSKTSEAEDRGMDF